MAARNLVETSVFAIIDYIKSNIATALNSIASERADNLVTTEAPANYYYYANVQVYQAPAIFVVPENIDFRKRELGANFIDAIIRTNVVAVVEDRDSKRLTTKAWRYQAALHQVLDQVEIDAGNNDVRIKIVITAATFSPIYTASGDLENPQGIFRQEIVLDVDVHHFEKT